jgi:hypothetical protein
MRTCPWFLMLVLLSACWPSPSSSIDPSMVADGGHTLSWPAQYASAYDFMVYAKRDGQRVTAETELSYGLADGYPAQGTLGTAGGYVLGSGCNNSFGEVVWQSLVDVQGRAALVELVGDRVSVSLRAEGTVTAVLQGEITKVNCNVAGGPLVTAIPLQHRIVLHVHRVAGFRVDQFHQQLYSCGDSVVLPTATWLWAPAVQALNAVGQRFDPVNAPTPASMTLRSAAALTSGADRGRLMADAGVVSIAVDTSLPVQGLRSFQVVGAETLTSVQAGLYLRTTANKGEVSAPIEEGRSYRVYFPDRPSSVDIRIEEATTTQGKLCANLPAAWLVSTSATPQQCAAAAASADPTPANPLPVATLLALGTCQMEVTIPGTNLRWPTTFNTHP